MERCIAGLTAAGFALNLLLASLAGDSGEQPTDRVSGQVSDGVQVVEFDDLGLRYLVDRSAKEVPIPDSVRELEGQRVQMRLYMYLTADEKPQIGLIGVPESKNAPKPSRAAPYVETLTIERARYIVPVILQEGLTIEWKDEFIRRPLLIEGDVMIKGDAIDLELERSPFWIENATYREVDGRDGYDRLWFLWPC